MGSSFVAFGGNGFWARDPSLEVWLYLLAQEAKHDSNTSDWLDSAAEYWLMQATVGFTGCVSPDLDRFVTGPERVRVLLELTDRALRRLDEFGQTVPATALNAMGTGGEGNYFDRDVPIDVFRSVGEQFRTLLSSDKV